MAIQRRPKKTTAPTEPDDVNAALGLNGESDSEGGSLAKVDPNHLPDVSGLQASQVTALIKQVEAMQTSEAEQDDRLIDFLAALHQRQRELTEFVRSARSAIVAGNTDLIAAVGDLSGAVADSMSGLASTSQTLSEVAGGAQLGNMFRRRSGNFARFNDLIAPKP